MKQLPLSGKGWAIVLIAAMIAMVGVLTVVKKHRTGGGDPPLNNLNSDSGSISLNNLDDDNPAPMPSGGGDGFSPAPGGDQPGVVTAGGTTEPAFDVPRDPVGDPPKPRETPRRPVVWVTETDAKAYKEPGFNMPIERDLQQWEELAIVASSNENWDHVQDLEGRQFWVQKKIVSSIRPQNLSQPSVAEKQVMQFYTQVSHREHSDAYVHLSPEWKKELSFDEFVKGYSRTDSLRSEIVSILELGEDRYQVDVAMEAIENGDSVDYLGIYTVGKVDGKWYITSGSLNKQARR